MEGKTYVVYIHENKIDHKKYVGITCRDVKKRWGKEGKGYKECPYFWNAIQKHGWDSFTHEILFAGLSHNEACDLEKSQIKELDLTNPAFGYNISSGGDGIDPQISANQWKREGFKEYASARMREAWKDKEKIKRRSNLTKQRWQDEDFRRKVTGSITESCKRNVRCVETGVVFDTIKDAAIWAKSCKPNIVRSAKTGYRCGGYHWEYVNE